jgi:hypothetical protein
LDFGSLRVSSIVNAKEMLWIGRLWFQKEGGEKWEGGGSKQWWKG